MRLGVKLREQLHEEAGRRQRARIVWVKKLIIWRKAGHGILSSRMNDLVPGQIWVISWKTETLWIASVFFPHCGLWLQVGLLHAVVVASLLGNELGTGCLGGMACSGSLLSVRLLDLSLLCFTCLENKGNWWLWGDYTLFLQRSTGYNDIEKAKMSPR